MRYLAGQLGIFALVTLAYVNVRPYLDMTLPEGKYWPAYGALLITPLILSFKQKPLFWCYVACAGAWGLNRYISAIGDSYLGHIPFAYLAIAGCCAVHADIKHKWMLGFTGAIIVYCAALMLVHWTTRPALTYFEILVYNLLYVGQITAPMLAKEKDGPHEAPAKNRPYEYKEAA